MQESVSTQSARALLVLLLLAPSWLSAEPPHNDETSSPPSEQSDSQESLPELPPQPAGALSELGDLERQAVRKVLRERQLTVVVDPEGRRIDEVIIAPRKVFSREDPKVLQWFNRFHWTSRPEVIRRDVLLEPGETWQEAKARETERNLRNPVYLSLAVVLPVESDEPGEIDLLVVTRDIWSLRTNSEFEYQNGTLSELQFSISENNLLGLHKIAAARFDMDLGEFAIGPYYYDPFLFGTHFQFESSADAVFNRQTGAFEGTRSSTLLSYPLWNLDRTWGGDLQVTHSDEVERRFRGIDLLPYDNPDTAAEESVGQEYRFRTFMAQLRGLYATGEKVEHRLGLGYRFELQQPEFVPDFPDDEQLRAAFRRDVMAPRERNSAIFASYDVFIPKWITYRNISSFDLPEEENVGPYASLEVAPTLEAFGSLESFLELRTTFGALVDLWRDGYVWAEISGSSRLRRDDWIDQAYTGVLHVATPQAFDFVRIVAQTRLDTYLRDTQNRIWFAGGQTGLRGYDIGEFSGEIRTLTNVELRSRPWKLWFLRVGGVAFYDVGDASGSFDTLNARHNVGIGLRVLIPQSNTVPARLDWAIPIDSSRNAFPGRIAIGFGQVF